MKRTARSVAFHSFLPPLVLLILSACNRALPTAEQSSEEVEDRALASIALSAPAFTLEWQAVTGLPTAIRAAAAASDGKRIHVLGGSRAGDLWTTLHQIYDPEKDTWKIGTPFTGERDFAMAEALSDGIHLIAGRDAQFKMDHQLYDPRTDSWTSRAPLPLAIDAAVIERVGNRIYVIGGNDLNQPISTVHIYHPARDKWTTGAPMPTARFSAASAAYRGRIFVAGGVLPGGQPTSVLEAYHPGRDRWETLAPMPQEALALGGGVVMRGGMVGNRFCVFGGTTIPNTGDAFPSAFCYDPTADAWSEGPDMLTPRAETAFVDHAGAVYAIGGRSRTAVATSTVEKLEAARIVGPVLRGAESR